LDEYDNETDDSSYGSIKFGKGNFTTSSGSTLIREENTVSAPVNKGAKTLIDDITDIFGTSSGSTQKGNDMGIFGGIDLTQGGGNVIGLDNNLATTFNQGANKSNPNDLLSSLGAVRKIISIIFNNFSFQYFLDLFRYFYEYSHHWNEQ
jgi:hypothetical protein